MKVLVYFSTPKKFLGTSYSHSAISFYEDCIDRQLVYEASHGEVHQVEFMNWQEKNEITLSLVATLNDNEFNDLYKFCIDNCNQPYGSLTLIGILIKEKLGFSKIGKDGNKKFICSELVAKALKLSDNDYTTPKDLENLIRKKYAL
jgi:hypothetical protein